MGIQSFSCINPACTKYQGLAWSSKCCQVWGRHNHWWCQHGRTTWHRPWFEGVLTVKTPLSPFRNFHLWDIHMHWSHQAIKNQALRLDAVVIFRDHNFSCSVFKTLGYAPLSCRMWPLQLEFWKGMSPTGLQAKLKHWMYAGRIHYWAGWQTSIKWPGGQGAYAESRVSRHTENIDPEHEVQKILWKANYFVGW